MESKSNMSTKETRLMIQRFEEAKPVDGDDDRAASAGVEDRPGEVVPRDSGAFGTSYR